MSNQTPHPPPNQPAPPRTPPPSEPSFQTPNLLLEDSPLKKSSRYNSRATKTAAVPRPLVKQIRTGLRLTMADKAVLVPVSCMMDKFVPAPTNVVEPTDDALFAIDFTAVPDKGVEALMYHPLANGMNDSGLAPGFKFVVTPRNPDPVDKTHQRDDVAMYLSAEVPSATGHTKWSSIELSVEIKPEPVQDDPFDESAPDYQPAALKRQEVLGQLQSYAALIFDKQHRTHHFSIIFFGTMARIIRWDRSGIIFTEKFNYKQNSALLGRFLWRFARLSRDKRGHDPTAVPVLKDSDEYNLMVHRAKTPREVKVVEGVTAVVGEHARHLFESSLDKNSTWWKLKIGDREFLVGAPHFIDSGLAGRATRGYVAIDLKADYGPFVYLKDCWRVAHDHIQREGNILEYLNDAKTGKVPNIPTLVCHDDIEEQRTQTQDVWKEQRSGGTTVPCPLKTYRHYRMVVEEVCLPMKEFRSGRELIGLLIMCMRAHSGAYKKGILHRDISDGNVLIFPRETIGPDGKVTVSRIGILADWELSKRVDDPDIPRQPDRTGTWQFLAAHVLKNLRKKILLEDEMESWLHLLLYFAIRYLPHNCDDVGSFINDYFDGYVERNGQYSCGRTKWSSVVQGVIDTDGNGPLKFFRSPPPLPLAPPRPIVNIHPHALGSNTKATSSTPNESDASSTTQTQGQNSTLSIPPQNDSLNVPEGSSSKPAPESEKTLSFEDDPKNEHPINMIIDDFLRAVHAYYELCKAAAPSPVRNGSTSTPLPRVAEVDEQTAQEPDEALDFLANEIKVPVTSSTPVRDAPDKLSAEARLKYERLAQKLQSHEAIFHMFGQYYMNVKWPTEDKQVDQLPKEYRPEREGSGVKRPSETTLEQPPAKRRSLCYILSGVADRTVAET
ncbi:hypothetical protein C8Q74DRAFT_1369944 [Fomes fomentarius]|nr:hypothetical protein C8Q74DRAFT_1369944 [Fomes fomentarius]